MRYPRRSIACAAVVGLLPIFARALIAQPVTPDFGTTSPVVYRIGYTEFVPFTQATSQIFSRGPYSLYSLDAPALFTAVPHIPTGALLTRIELGYCDFNTSGKRMTVTLTECATDGTGCTTLKTFDSNSGVCGTKTVGLASLGYTMQNDNRELIVEVVMTAGDSTNRLTGINIGYKLQVSPGPGVATFADVPTTSPIFPFVEALYAAGITAGCGNGNFCPNQPLTRGQMAVFLSTALGLHFPN